MKQVECATSKIPDANFIDPNHPHRQVLETEFKMLYQLDQEEYDEFMHLKRMRSRYELTKDQIRDEEYDELRSRERSIHKNLIWLHAYEEWIFGKGVGLGLFIGLALMAIIALSIGFFG